MCVVALPLLSGCTLTDRMFHRGRTSAACHEKPFAGNADSRPGLKVPEGLSAPDTRNAVKVPAPSAADQPRSRSEPCLALPPNFFAAPLLPGKGKPLAPAPAVPTTPATATPVPAPTSPAPTSPAPSAPAAPATPAAPVATPGEPVPPG
jgi:hypothetical protein